MQDLALLVLGWLLGLFSTPLGSFLKRPWDRKEFKQALLAELGRLAYRMAHVVFMMEQLFGTLDRVLLQWLLGALQRYEKEESQTNLLVGIRGLLQFDDAQLVEALARKRREAVGQGITVKESHLPFLETHLGDLRLFKPVVQRHILEVITQLGLYNAHVADAREWFRMTFDQSLNETNHRAVEDNLERTYKNMAERARFLVEEIASLEKALSPRRQS